MPKKILFIEDDPATVDVYERALEGLGFEVEVMELGNKAVEEIEKIAEKKAEKPDLVLLDLILPDINGIEVLKKIRDQEETKDIPVFVLTNYDDKKLRGASEELKAEEFLLKTDYTPTELAIFVKEKIGK